MKTIKNIIILCLLTVVMAGCEKEGDMIYLYGQEESKLTATASEVILSQDKSAELALSLVWSKSVLTVSNPDMSAPDLESIYIQASTQNDFSSAIESPESSLSRSYTGADLNTMAKNLNLVADVATPVYFRIKSLTGNNMEPLYSNVVSVKITSFEIDMSIGFILDSKKEDTGVTLVSPRSNGIYTGFMGASGWYNYYLREGDGTIWGNLGVDGSEFLASSDNSNWNFWFPGQTGCYFVEVNTVKREWSALLIPTLSVSGDVKGEMTFDRPNNLWYFVFDATKAGTYTISLQGTGKQYNATTKTSDDAAIETAVAFAQENGSLVFGSQVGNISVNVPAAGESTLIIDLSDPNNWECKVVSGSSEPEVKIEYLYLPGIDDNISGSWTFDNYLSLYNEDEKAYAGVVNVNSAWGYSINIAKDNWGDKYTISEGDAYSGTLVWQGSTNLPAPDAGLYLIEVSLKNLTYNLISVGEKIYLSGLNDAWDFNTSLDKTEIAGIYSGEITITKVADWGFQIHTDDSWSHKFGGSEGKLYYQGSNITDDAPLGPGTYLMTVDLVNMTYSIE